MTAKNSATVLILGAGINGCAIARELVLNGVPVHVVDRSDIAWGATSRSSRLIHGGLRYLEHGEFRLVRESLEERTRLGQLAPQFVRPFSLHIPVARRTGGLWRSAVRFLGRGRWGKSGHEPRGLWLVRLGLWFYDRFVSDPAFPNSRVLKLSSPNVPKVDATRYRWLCRYTDAQMLYPERFVISMLLDARQLAQEHRVAFQVSTYHEATFQGKGWVIRDRETGTITEALSPALVINATGAWGDLTLDRLSVPAPQLFGGTKGSHFVTYHPSMCEAVGQQGVYAEAEDGRLVFILPMGQGVMVGTTDERFEGNPDEAVATEAELNYLIEMVNDLFPQVSLQREHVEMHCAGVRPLPRADVNSTSAISRDHSVHVSDAQGISVLTLVGGKLTTARAFGESVADDVLTRLGMPRIRGTRDRVFPGATDYPSKNELAQFQANLARQFARPLEQIQAMWPLCGTEVIDFLNSAKVSDSRTLSGTQLPKDFVRWVINREWVRTLEDVIERRLMLVYQPQLSLDCLHDLAELLLQAGCLKPEERENAIERAIRRLEQYYGKQVITKDCPPGERKNATECQPANQSSITD